MHRHKKNSYSYPMHIFLSFLPSSAFFPSNSFNTPHLKIEDKKQKANKKGDTFDKSLVPLKHSFLPTRDHRKQEEARV